MPQKWTAIIGFGVTFGLFVLTYAKRLADAISIIHLSHDAGEFLTAMSETPMLISNGALAIGIICLAYLVAGSLKTNRQQQAPIIARPAENEAFKPHVDADSARLTPTPPAVALEPKKPPPYLPDYANYMSTTLRQIRNVINESVRDSTTLTLPFQIWHTQRFQMLVQPGRTFPSAKAETEELQKHLSALVKFYADIDRDLSAILVKDRSYLQDLSPFTDITPISEEYRSLLNEFREFLSIFSANENRLDGAPVGLIQGYCSKVVSNYREQEKRSAAALPKIDAKLADLANNR